MIASMADDVIAALHLAGFALAHAAWSIEDGEILCTLAAVAVDEKREFVRYEADSIPESAELADQHLRQRLASGGYAAVVTDGFATLGSGSRSDALLVELLGSGGRSLGIVAQPYRPGRRLRIPFVGRRSKFAILGDPIISKDIEVPNAREVLLESARTHFKAGPIVQGVASTRVGTIEGRYRRLYRVTLANTLRPSVRVTRSHADQPKHHPTLGAAGQRGDQQSSRPRCILHA